MTSIQAGISVQSPHIKALDLSGIKNTSVVQADEQTYKTIITAQERMLEQRYTQSSDAASQLYARVVVNGKVVAKIDNNGFTETSNALGAKMQNLFANEDATLKGPELAQDRAAKIAALLDGTVEKSPTAMSQAAFSAASNSSATIDYKAMESDPAYEQLQKTKQARTLFLTQQIAQEGRVAEISAQDDGPDAVTDFLEYMSMTPEERYYAALLAEEGLTQEELAALPPEERMEIEEKIREKIEEHTKDDIKENANKVAESDATSQIERYQIPQWMAQYGVELSAMLGGDTTDTQHAGAKAPQIGMKAEREEYSSRVRAHFETVLDEAGIVTQDDYNKALIQDKSSSEEIRKTMEERIENDDRLNDLKKRVIG